MMKLGSEKDDKPDKTPEVSVMGGTIDGCIYVTNSE